MEEVYGMTLSYIWERFWRKLPGAAIRDSKLEKPVKIGTHSTVIQAEIGHYSYCGYDCTLINCRIGRYCSLANHVSIGLAGHPMGWASTSPAFYLGGGGAAPGALGSLQHNPSPQVTTIGNDVWVGQDVLIKPGVVIGNGAVIGMGSVVTKDVPPYAVVAGNPARLIKMRFAPELVERLEMSRWWDIDPSVLKQYALFMEEPEKFLKALEADQ